MSATLIFKLDTFGKPLIAKASLALTALAGEQPLPSVTLVTTTLCAAAVLVKLAAGMVKVPLPLLIVTLPTKPVAVLGAPKS